MIQNVPAPSFEASAIERFAGYGVVGIIAIAFAIVIRHLYTTNRDDGKAAAKREADLIATQTEEREQWIKDASQADKKHELAMSQLRLDCEKDKREVFDLYRKREDEIRKEFAAAVDKLANAQITRDAAMLDMLKKFQERLASIKEVS